MQHGFADFSPGRIVGLKKSIPAQRGYNRIVSPNLRKPQDQP